MIDQLSKQLNILCHLTNQFNVLAVMCINDGRLENCVCKAMCMCFYYASA